MKRILCLVFLLLMLLGFYFGVHSTFGFCDAKQIIMISHNYKDGAVNNGDHYIFKSDEVVVDDGTIGMSLYFSKDWDYKNNLLNKYGAYKLNSYYIESTLVIEGYLKYCKWQKFQMAVTLDEVIVGFPSILNGF